MRGPRRRRLVSGRAGRSTRRVCSTRGTVKWVPDVADTSVHSLDQQHLATTTSPGARKIRTARAQAERALAAKALRMIVGDTAQREALIYGRVTRPRIALVPPGVAVESGLDWIAAGTRLGPPYKVVLVGAGSLRGPRPAELAHALAYCPHTR